MNMIDYCTWRGDITFKSDPFNEVDNLLLSQITYIAFDDFFAYTDKKTIKELSKACQDNIDTFRNASKLVNESIKVLEAMANTKRFKDCVVHHYCSKLYKDSTEQLAVMMIDLPDNTTVVSFRGTDDTLIGWKEDLMLSYKSVNAQRDAVKYVEENCNHLFKKYRFIGHSKGGNLAIYAATNCNKKLQKKIIQIISNDGPGLMRGSYLLENYNAIKDRYKLIASEKYGVGTIYEMAKNKTLAKTSTNNFASAHNMLTWAIEGNHLIRAAKESNETELTRKIILQFLEDTDETEREILVEEIFKCLEQHDIHTTTQLFEGGIPLFVKILKSLSEMDSVAKKAAGKMLKTIYDNIGSDIYKNIYKGRQNKKKDNDNIDTSK